MRKGKVFIDANILIYAGSFKKADVLQWINDLYEDIYIHITVYEELQLSSVKKQVNQFLDNGEWTLFDPEDNQTVSDDLYAVYDSYVDDIRNYFKKLDRKKMAESRNVKNTNDLGEIHSLAAAVLLGAKIICSNDLDIREVIEDNNIEIVINDEESTLIVQDTLMDFCLYISTFKIAKLKLAKQFLKSVHPNKLNEFDTRLNNQ